MGRAQRPAVYRKLIEGKPKKAKGEETKLLHKLWKAVVAGTQGRPLTFDTVPLGP